MTPIDHNRTFSLPPLEGNQDQIHYLPFTPTNETSSFPCPIFFNPSQQEGRAYNLNPSQQEGRAYNRDQHQQHEDDKRLQFGGASDCCPLPQLSINPTANNNRNSNISSEGSISDPYARDSDPLKNKSVKWMSSKMRLMRKMMSSDRIVISKPRKSMQVLYQDQQQSTGEGNNSNSNSNSSNGIIRVCSDCNTTKTPLWRSGPRGPKSLCNACGIRQRKARKAMAAAATGGGLIPTDAPTEVHKAKRMDGDRTLPFKKRCKITSTQAHKKHFFDDLTINLHKNSAFHRVLPQDEKEAAILLMALSCGLIYG